MDEVCVNVFFWNPEDGFACWCVCLTLVQQLTTCKNASKAPLSLFGDLPCSALQDRSISGPETGLSEGRFGRNAWSPNCWFSYTYFLFSYTYFLLIYFLYILSVDIFISTEYELKVLLNMIDGRHCCALVQPANHFSEKHFSRISPFPRIPSFTFFRLESSPELVGGQVSGGGQRLLVGSSRGAAGTHLVGGVGVPQSAASWHITLAPIVTHSSDQPMHMRELSDWSCEGRERIFFNAEKISRRKLLL